MTSTRRQAVVVGSGIAGLSAALHLGHCTVVTKTTLGAGSTRWAQGGLAAALGPGDSPDRHLGDTLRVSAGLADPEIARLVVAGAPRGIEWLSGLGARFDQTDGTLLLGREAGHSANRIVHADGDATGPEVMRALTTAVHERPDIEVLEHTLAVDLVVDDGAVTGLSVIDAEGAPSILPTTAVVLATGGIGQVYSATTNPIESTGDGLAMAWRAGATVRDCEFVQFHPTALAAGLDPLPLLTEALRGAGGLLVNDRGERFMRAVHDDAELAPRDIVARAIWQQLHDGPVFLDVRSVERVSTRFPTAAANAASAGLEIETDLLPVTPAQHYFMGGVAVDRRGHSSLPGLWAAGEVSSTGLHGGNRLASNSLIEGLVFGRVIADSIVENPAEGTTVPRQHRPASGDAPVQLLSSGPEPAAEIDALRSTMWQHGGIVRSATGLAQATETIETLRPALENHAVARNLSTAAELVVRAATARRESRGAHHRIDFPKSDPALSHPILRRRSDRRATVGGR